MFYIYARAIIFNQKGEILLMKKNDHQKIGAGKWIQPGGTLEFGETPEATLIREIKEEIDLEVTSLHFLTIKSMLLGEDQRLGFYYQAEVKDENFHNNEPEKHEIIAWKTITDLPKMIHSDVIFQAYTSSFGQQTKYHIPTTSYNEHTMGQSLLPYIDIKIHHCLDELNFQQIHILPLYDHDFTNTIISKKEKTGKKFNRKRPTGEIEDNIFLLKCFPGIAYVQHYASLVKQYFLLHNKPLPLISYSLPNEEQIKKAINLTNFVDIPKADVVIVGMVEQLQDLLPNSQWNGTGDFEWKIGIINNQTFMLLGCKFSFWGDIAGTLVKCLSEKGIKKIIYVGKLGGLKQGFMPNETLATGNNSFVNGSLIERENPFQTIKEENLIHGKHYTSNSLLFEDKKRLQSVQNTFDFVDPEIGYMAKAAIENRIQFGYLHIISNNLTQEFEDNLSNERNENIKTKRKILFEKIKNILQTYL